MQSAFGNGLRMVGIKRNQLLAKKVVTPLPMKGIDPVVPPQSAMGTPGIGVQPVNPIATPQMQQTQGTQGSLVKDVLRRKRMLEI